MTNCNSTNPDVSKYSDFQTALDSLPLDSQKGGNIGYNLRVENPTIGGLAEVRGYNNQPELVDGKFSETVDSCDSAEMTGGKRRTKVSKSRRTKVSKSRRTKVSKSRRNKMSKSRRNKMSKSRRNKISKSRRNKSRRTKSRRNNRKKNLKGGMADIEQAFNGSDSIYTPNMDFRNFDCKQPVWEPKCA